MNRFASLPVLLAFAGPALPWGCEGHQTIALIALQQLTPNAGAAAARLLQGMPAYPLLHRFCGSSGLVPFADMSTWADDIRGKRKETAPWHYIDIPLGVSRDRMYDYCDAATGCVTRVIRGQMDVLRSATASDAEKAEALMFVIHLVGDLHQPLHAANNNDRGGNCVPVAYLSSQPKQIGSGENFRPNLHGVWDTELVDQVAKGRGATEFAGALALEFAADI